MMVFLCGTGYCGGSLRREFQAFLFCSVHCHLRMGPDDPAFYCFLQIHMHPGDSEVVQPVSERLSVGKQIGQCAHEHVSGCSHIAFQV